VEEERKQEGKEGEGMGIITAALLEYEGANKRF
jgi:hypothetical protein